MSEIWYYSLSIYIEIRSIYLGFDDTIPAIQFFQELFGLVLGSG